MTDAPQEPADKTAEVTAHKTVDLPTMPAEKSKTEVKTKTEAKTKAAAKSEKTAKPAPKATTATKAAKASSAPKTAAKTSAKASTKPAAQTAAKTTTKATLKPAAKTAAKTPAKEAAESSTKATAAKPSASSTVDAEASADAKPAKPAGETETPAESSLRTGSTRRSTSASERERELNEKLLLSRLNAERSGSAEKLAHIPEASADNPAPWLQTKGKASGLPTVTVKGTPPMLTKADAETTKEAVSETAAPKATEETVPIIPVKDMGQAMIRSAEKGTDKATDKAAAKPTAEKSAAKSSDKASGKATAKPTLKPASKASAKSAVSKLVKPAPKKRAAKPAEKTGAIEASASASSAPTLSDLVAHADTGLPPGALSQALTATEKPAEAGSDKASQTEPRPTSPAGDRTNPADASKALTDKTVNPDEPDAHEPDETGLYPVIRLTGRKSRIEAPEAQEPEAVVNLEEEREAAELLARTSYRNLQRRNEARRSEIEARIAKDAMDKAGYAQADHEAERRQALHAQMSLNSVREAAAEHAGMTDRKRVPMPDTDRALLDDPAASADYARRMHEWESALIAAEDQRQQLDAPNRRMPVPPREPLPTGTDTTLGGFPSAVPLREWHNDDLPPPSRTERIVRFIRTHLAPSVVLTQWDGLDRLLRAGLVTVGITAVAAGASWITCRWVVPELTLRSTPVTVTAVVSDDDIRDLMMLAALLENRGMTSGRTPPEVSLTYLPSHLREQLANDTPEARMALPLTDELLRAAIVECADEVGAPVVSRKMVLAVPAVSSAQGASVDVTANIASRLGLTGISAAAAREAIEATLMPNSPASPLAPSVPTEDGRSATPPEASAKTPDGKAAPMSAPRGEKR